VDEETPAAAVEDGPFALGMQPPVTKGSSRLAIAIAIAIAVFLDHRLHRPALLSAVSRLPLHGCTRRFDLHYLYSMLPGCWVMPACSLTSRVTQPHPGRSLYIDETHSTHSRSRHSLSFLRLGREKRPS